MKTDFEVVDRIDVADTQQLSQELSRGSGPSRPAIRLLGNGGHQHRLPGPGRPVRLVGCSRLNQIERLEPEDLTCTVQPGVPLDSLAMALAERGVCLPCEGEGQGTVGGMFARGDDTPAAPGAVTTRGLLLGFEGILTDGTSFKSGARVVKSVAGFDLGKLFVGSRGRLFAVTRLHLKLRPQPRAKVDFASPAGDLSEAIDRYRQLRHDAVAPAALELSHRSDGECRVRGRFEGTAEVVAAALSRHGLQPEPIEPPTRTAPAGLERTVGTLRPSHLQNWASKLPQQTDWRVNGSGQFAVDLTADQTDALLSELPALDAHGEVRDGTLARRGLATPLPAAVTRLMTDLKHTLDPHDVLV